MSGADTAPEAHADCVSVNTELDLAPDEPVTSCPRTEGDEGTLVNTFVCSVSLSEPTGLCTLL